MVRKLLAKMASWFADMLNEPTSSAPAVATSHPHPAGKAPAIVMLLVGITIMLILGLLK